MCGDQQGLALAAGDGAFFVIDERTHRPREAHGQVGVELLLLQLGNGAALPLKVLDLQLQLAVEFVEGLRGAHTRRIGRVRIHIVHHAPDTLERESQRRESPDAQHARKVLRAVVAVAVRAARRLGKKPDGVVVAQRAYRAPGQFRQFARLHGLS